MLVCSITSINRYFKECVLKETFLIFMSFYKATCTLYNELFRIFPPPRKQPSQKYHLRIVWWNGFIRSRTKRTFEQIRYFCLAKFHIIALDRFQILLFFVFSQNVHWRCQPIKSLLCKSQNASPYLWLTISIYQSSYKYIFFEMLAQSGNKYKVARAELVY